MGYARLRDFNSIVANTLKDALVEMKAEGADEFVLDLRGNGGGAFQSALGVAGLFMESKPITYVVSLWMGWDRMGWDGVDGVVRWVGWLLRWLTK